MAQRISSIQMPKRKDTNLTGPVRVTRSTVTSRTEKTDDSQFQMGRTSSKQRPSNVLSSVPQNSDYSRKNTEKRSRYAQDTAVLGSPRPRRSHSVGTSGRDVSPNNKHRRENTPPLPMEVLDDSMYYYSTQTGIGNSSSQKQFQTSTDDVLDSRQSYNRVPKLKRDLDLNLRSKASTTGPLKASTTGPLKASHRLENLGLKSKIQSRISLSPKWGFLLSNYYDVVVGILESKLRENIVLHLNKNIATLQCENVEVVKSLLKNDLIVIDHDSGQQHLLRVEAKKWQNLIDILQKDFFCVIFSKEDFSKTYVCTTAAESELILSEISKFLDQNTSGLKISPHVMEFVKHNLKFSDLTLEKAAEDSIWIRDITRSRIAELKEEIKKVIFQSYLLDDNQYEMLCAEKKEVFSDIERKFQVKGSPYQLPIVGDIPVVFQVNPLTNISCVVDSDPENIPVDSLISVDWQAAQSTSGIPVEIKKCFKWESPARQHFQIKAFGSSTTNDEWTRYFFESLANALSEDLPPMTIGISLPLTYFRFKDICVNILGALKMLWGKSMIPSQLYVILIVPEEKMKSLADKVLKTPTVKSLRSPDEGLSDNRFSTKLFAVKVVLGNLADQHVDVIVNSTNEDLTLRYGKISSALLEKAGPGLQRECSKYYPKGISFPTSAVTSGCKLPCKNVIHGALPINNGDATNNRVIKRFVYDCLKTTVKSRHSSIAFPALGTGILKYPISHVVQQMNEAFKSFEKKHPETSLQEIRIVLYSEEMGLDLFYQLDNSQKDLSGTEMIQEESKENPGKSMNWIQFVNYSCIDENLSLAISALEEQLKQPRESSVKIPLKEFEDVFFFKDLRSVIPNIVQQLDSKTEQFYHLHLSAETEGQLGGLMLEVKKNIQKEQLNIIPPVSGTVLDLCLLKTKQLFPQVKFIETNNGQTVIVQSLDWNLTQEAKYYLEIWLGMKSAAPVSEDRFNKSNNSTVINSAALFSPPTETLIRQSRFNKNYQRDLQPASAAAASVASPTQGPVTQSSQNSQEYGCCYQTENGLLIKVYQGNLLNVDVDGIVNAANKWLAHSGGVARAIINAAGDTVNREGQSKLKGRTLNDGEVLSTSAGNLKRYKNIIHAVGPMYAAKNDDYCFKKIASAVSKSLQEAKNLKLRSVALPAISSAIFGVPMDICTRGYYVGVRMFSENNPNSCLKEVHFVDKQDICIKEIKNFFKSYFIPISEDTSSRSNRQSSKNISPPSSRYKADSSPPSSRYKAESSPPTIPTQWPSSPPSTYYKAESSPPTQKEADTKCLICLEDMKNPRTLEKCKHVFCANCITQSMKYYSKCPVCRIPFGIETGDQPPGTMSYYKLRYHLPGYDMDETFWIKYDMKNPSDRRSTTRDAYLPANEEGTVVLKMLQLAFERRLVFTVGESRTTGAQNVITWNDIHHKTSISGGPVQFGYPDPTYLKRVTEELADHGITPADVTNRKIQESVKTP